VGWRGLWVLGLSWMRVGVMLFAFGGRALSESLSYRYIGNSEF
jgi:hypothetical protein